MGYIPLVIALAVGWHTSIIWLERSRRPNLTRPPLPKLLQLAELDLLSTIRGELIRLARTKPKLRPRYERKLCEVNEQIRTLEESDAG